MIYGVDESDQIVAFVYLSTRLGFAPAVFSDTHHLTKMDSKDRREMGRT